MIVRQLSMNTRESVEKETEAEFNICILDDVTLT